VIKIKWLEEKKFPAETTAFFPAENTEKKTAVFSAGNRNCPLRETKTVLCGKSLREIVFQYSKCEVRVKFL